MQIYELTLRGAVEVLRDAARYLCIAHPTDIAAIVLINAARFELLKEQRRLRQKGMR